MLRPSPDRRSAYDARARLTVGAVVTLALLLVTACSSGQTRAGATPTPSPVTTSPPATRSTTPPATTPPPSPTRSPACTTAGVVRSWPLPRLAAAVVSVPVLDFDLASVTSEVRDGAGGVLFLGSAAAPADLAARVRALVGNAPAKTRPLVMADEEGGGVQRLAPLVSPVPWPRDMAATMTPAEVRALAARVGRQMRAAGVTVDLAPVADVDGRPGPTASNPDGRRAFSGNAATAATYTVAFLNGLRDGGVLPVVKHFPGLGGSTTNTDVGPAATQPISDLQASGLVPFRAAVRAGAPAVMVANASVPGLTSEPASLSRAVTTDLLRGGLGFHGLVVTDSLSAGAIRATGRTLPQAAVAAVAAGADLVLFGSTMTAADTEQLRVANLRRTYDEIVTAITAAVRSGQLPADRLVAAATAVAEAAHHDLCS